NGAVYFQGIDAAHGAELWKSDGTPTGSVLAADVVPGTAGSSAQPVAVAGGLLYFLATDSTGVKRLWQSDGAAASPAPLAGASPAADPARFVAASGSRFFDASAASGHNEPARTDGPAPGTVRP